MLTYLALFTMVISIIKDIYISDKKKKVKVLRYILLFLSTLIVWVYISSLHLLTRTDEKHFMLNIEGDNCESEIMAIEYHNGGYKTILILAVKQNDVLYKEIGVCVLEHNYCPVEENTYHAMYDESTGILTFDFLYKKDGQEHRSIEMQLN